MFLWTGKLCKSEPIRLCSKSILLFSHSYCLSSPNINPSEFQETVETAVKNRDFKHLADLFSTRNQIHPQHHNNPFSFLTPQNQTQIIDQILQSFNSLKLPRPHHAYHALLAQTCQPISVELALTVLQSMIRIDCKPTRQTRLSLSKAWCRRRRHSTVREIISAMRNRGYPPDQNTCNYLLGSLCIVNAETEARVLLQELCGAGCPPDTESFHLVIAAACRRRDTAEARGLVEEMVVREGLTPKQNTVTYVLGAMKKTGEGREAAELVVFLEREGCVVDFHGYEMVAETCLERRDFVAAAKVVLEMVARGMIPYIGVRQGLFEGLLSVGERDMAWAVRRRLVELGC